MKKTADIKKDIQTTNEKARKKIKAFFALKMTAIVCAILFIILVLFSTYILGEDNILASTIGDINTIWKSFVDILPELLRSVFTIIIFMAISKIIRMILAAIFKKVKNKKQSVGNLVDSGVKYIFGIIIIFRVLSIWGVDTATLLASAGILGIVVGLGAQSLISDILNGLCIVFEKTFQIGDIIVVDGFRGTVSEIGIRNTKLVDAGGDIKVISNSDVRTIINMTKNNSIAICDIGIDYGESIERVEAAIAKELPAITKKIPGIIEGPFYKGVSEIGEYEIVLKFIAKCKETDRFQVTRDLNREFILMFKRNNIKMSYPQVVVNQPTIYPEDKGNAKKAQAFVDQQKEVSKEVNDK